MYHPQIVARRREQAEALLGEILPKGLREYTVPEVEEFKVRLSNVYVTKKKQTLQTRALTSEEQTFILNEQAMTKVSWEYWAERYCMINIAGQALAPMYPLWGSQRLILSQLGKLELERFEQDHPDGVLAMILKARQLGASTMSESMLAHRTTTHGQVQAALASDSPESSGRLFRMYERIIDNLPWWVKPQITDWVKNEEIAFGQGSIAYVLAGKSTRGKEGARGQLGRGATFGVSHLTEVSTWDNPQQIDDAFLPAVPTSPMTLLLWESTAKGRGKNWWYTTWKKVTAGKHQRDIRPIFIPWYAEQTKYWAPYPTDWEPNTTTLVHARRAAEYGPRWMGGPVALTKEQLYWYERARVAAEETDELAKFLEEYPADDEEAFQHSGRSVFSLQVRERIRQHLRPVTGLIEIKPLRELGR